MEKITPSSTRNTFDFVGAIQLKDMKLNAKGKNNTNWAYNQLTLNIFNGENNIFMSLMGGFLENKDITVKGKQKNDTEEKELVIPFSNRLDFSNYEINPMYLFRVFTYNGVDDFNKYKLSKEFVTEYDLIKYLSSTLQDGMVIRLCGDLSYQEFNGKVSRQYRVRKVYIMNDDTTHEGHFKTKNTLLIDSNSIKSCKEENDKITYQIEGKQYIKNKNGGDIIPVKYEMSFPLDKKEIANKIVDILFKVKGDITKAIKVNGAILSGRNVEQVNSATLTNTEDMLLYEEMFGKEKLEEAKRNMVETTYRDINLIISPIFKNDGTFDIDEITYADILKQNTDDEISSYYDDSSVQVDDDDLPF